MKVWHYYCHAVAAGWDVGIRFTERSRWDDTNPWTATPDGVLLSDHSFPPDAVFLAGRDWEHLPASLGSAPVINLIQHVRHADPADTRYAYLSRPALRICVSPEVARAIEGTGCVAGPVLVIPDGLDPSGFPEPCPFEQRPVDICVVALKQKALGAQVASRLRSRQQAVRLLTEHVPRERFLATLGDARIVVVLPNRVEGFCLPALEAMALGAIVVIPDVVGNRSFCIDGVNCLMPEFEEDDVVVAAERALAFTPREAEQFRSEAEGVVAKHTLDNERAAFHSVLARLDDLWAVAAQSVP